MQAAASLAPNLERNAIRRVDEDSVAAGAQVKGDVLVRLVAGSAPILVPKLDALSDFVEAAEALAQAVDRLADPEFVLREDVMLKVAHVFNLLRASGRRAVRKADAAVQKRRELLRVVRRMEPDRERVLIWSYRRRKRARGKSSAILAL